MCLPIPLSAVLFLSRQHFASFQQTDFNTCSAVKEIHALLPLIKGYSSVFCLYQSQTSISILLHISKLEMPRYSCTTIIKPAHRYVSTGSRMWDKMHAISRLSATHFINTFVEQTVFCLFFCI